MSDRSESAEGGSSFLVRVDEEDDLLEMLRNLLRRESERMNAEWGRSVPFSDLISDRWLKAARLGFGDKSSIYDNSLVIGDVTVGEGTWIGPFTVLDGSGGLVIGSYCSISAGVQIYTHDTVDWALSGGKEDSQKAPVSIGSRCYIGPNVIISKGIVIGDGCVIGANSFVNRSIPAGTKAWGSPARVVESAYGGGNV